MNRNERMAEQKEFPQRKRMRLQGYDYSLPSDYFVTIVTQGRICRFGDVVDGDMRLNDAGRMVANCYRELCQGRDNVECLDYVVMPNHLHFILRIYPCQEYKECGSDMGLQSNNVAEFDKQNSLRSQQYNDSREFCLSNSALLPALPVSLPELVKRLKSKTTVAYINGIRQQGWPPFQRKLWQQGYYEHIIRSQRVFDYIRGYIFQNPERWIYDKVNPLCSDITDDINQGIKNLY